MMRRTAAVWLSAAWCSVVACTNPRSATDHETQATLDIKHFVGVQLAKLTEAAQAIKDAAPAPDDDGWNAEDDRQALQNMRTAWKQARSAYEHIEGSIAVLFMPLDIATDARYDDFIETETDDNMFDDEGVIGMHAVERILWSDSIPAHVIEFEKALPAYEEPAFPQTKQQADGFKNALCARLVRDTKHMQRDFQGLALEASTAFRGMILSVQEQSEKTTKAASGEDESRYAQNTLADMRANLAGARAVFEAFRPWIQQTQGDGAGIERGLDKLEAAYAEVDGDALPKVPDHFNPDSPHAVHLETPYGKLWKLLGEQTDSSEDGSLLSIMADAAERMDILGVEVKE